MEKSFRLSLDIEDNPPVLRAELVFCKLDGRTVITVGMNVPNQLGDLTIAQAQAKLLRMAAADLEKEAQRLDMPVPGSTTP